MIIKENSELRKELGPYEKWLRGRILNAGCGSRYLELGENSVRLDINPDFAVACDVIADVHCLPYDDCSFDTILSVGVLEHTRYPWEVVTEFYRVLRPGGVVILALPFFQPKHGAPYDYYRFTESGSRALVEWANFRVIQVDGVHTFGFVCEWILKEILIQYPVVRKILWPVRKYVFPLLKNGKLFSAAISNLQSGYYVVAEKPNEIPR